MSRKKRTFSQTKGAAAALVLVASVFATGACWAGVKFKTLHKFEEKTRKKGVFADGGLVFDSAGNLYGTTSEGGAYGNGAVFKLAPKGDGTWLETVLHSFQYDTDGANPEASLIFDAKGSLYGTTHVGGSRGGGTVFQLTPNGEGTWTEKTLHQFGFGGGDGDNPRGRLIFDKAGNLYGTTQQGGAYVSYGTIFKLTPNVDGSWTESVLHSFNDDRFGGYSPDAGLVLDSDGNLYGTTSEGGSYGGGTVFKLSATGPHRTWAESLLYQFCFLTECSDGAAPVGDLIFDHAGSLYGTTLSGGAYGPGTVFRLTLDINGMWTENVLHSFNYTDGSSPFAGLVFDAAGNLYGTTWWGGDPICDQGCGVVFKLQPTARRRWRETVLHLFSNRPGALPRAGLIFDGHGNLYGTSSGDAMDTWGSVFEITP